MIDLTFQDKTQQEIVSHLRETENLLALCAQKLSAGEGSATITAMPDLGLPNNVARMMGGFYTGAVYEWDSNTPFVPVDATVNACGVSVFKIAKEFPGQNAFYFAAERARTLNEDAGLYAWNYSNGNHFISYGTADGSGDLAEGAYLIIHSGAAEYKNQYNGLYPTPGNWYYDEIQVMAGQSNRYLRYITGKAAEKFSRRAVALQSLNRARHRYHAELICGAECIDDEILYTPHYGMISESSIAIGVSWPHLGEPFPILTRPNREIYIARAIDGGKNHPANRTDLHLQPHGLGQMSITDLKITYESNHISINGRNFRANQSFANTPGYDLRELEDAENCALPRTVAKIIETCPSQIAGRIVQIASIYGRRRSAE